MKIGIIGAMDEEIAILLDKMTNKKEHEIANTLFVEGYLENQAVVLLKSGIGKVNAAMGTTVLHERFSPSHIINTGSAGGFSSDLNVGDIVIANYVVHHDVDVTAFDYELGQVPGMPAMFPANQELNQIASEVITELHVNAATGIIATGDQFMSNEAHVALVKRNFPNMIAAEMEAAAIAQVSYQYDIPFVIIRALSDIAGKDSTITFDNFLETAAKNASNIIINMMNRL